jgi:hypothetical protein
MLTKMHLMVEPGEKESSDGSDKEIAAIFYMEGNCKIILIFGIQIPAVVFCGRKHFSLYSDEDLHSLDTVGSLEGPPLPSEDKMEDHL